MQGLNATIMCYGMTGSGKTYTMFGPGHGKELGVVGLLAQKLLSGNPNPNLNPNPNPNPNSDLNPNPNPNPIPETESLNSNPNP
jgi:hypothetical protein